MRTISKNVSLLASIAPQNWLCTLVVGFFKFEDRSRQRRALAALDDRLLRDVGLSRADVEREYNRPFWQ
jgi:uncharacterized protein YjiS (DUF1127 family)